MSIQESIRAARADVITGDLHLHYYREPDGISRAERLAEGLAAYLDFERAINDLRILRRKLAEQLRREGVQL